MKLIIIGPLPPLRGGIAHSNSTLCNNLSKNNELVAINFSRLFPKLLYPGKFQDSGGNEKFPFRSEKILDSINPISWINAMFLIIKEKPSIIIFQWWHTFFMPAYFSIALFARIFTHAKIAMVLQCTLPHEKNLLHVLLAKLMFSQADYFVAQSTSDAKDAKKLRKNARIKFIPEPPYLQFRATKKTGVSNRILFFGFVRKYKGLRFLLEAMPEILKKNPGIMLDVVGEFWEKKEPYLQFIKDLGIEKNVKIIDSYVPDDEVEKYFLQSDCVVLPYTSSTQSGIIQLAFGFGVPVISTDVGGNKDLIKNGTNGLLVKPKSAKALSDAVKKFYTEKLYTGFSKEIQKTRKELKWNLKKEKKFLDLE